MQGSPQLEIGLRVRLSKLHANARLPDLLGHSVLQCRYVWRNVVAGRTREVCYSGCQDEDLDAFEDPIIERQGLDFEVLPA